MPTFIKPGFWNKKRKQLAGELNLDELIQQNSSPLNYKSYVALISQTGINPTVLWNTPFVVGNTYAVFLISSDDFSNIGYVQSGVAFVATGTTPTSWGEYNSQVIEILSSTIPTIEVIENTLGITLTVSYRTSSTFFFNSNLPVFLQNKTLLYPQGFVSNNGLNIQGSGMVRINDSQLIVPLFNLGSTAPFTIEIKVYN